MLPRSTGPRGRSKQPMKMQQHPSLLPRAEVGERAGVKAGDGEMAREKVGPRLEERVGPRAEERAGAWLEERVWVPSYAELLRRRFRSPRLELLPRTKPMPKRPPRELAEAEVPASMEHPVDRFNAQLRDLEDDKGQEYDDTKKTWGKVSEELKLKLKPLIYKLEKPLEHL